ncbi:hypothetical protein J7T55_005402 [Diaporthe amygdali]|uniref:uncharacterized protein n=1 Tax=Phomopsis amygdali TaxID=1214568 RepID=UPI0022FF165D|nr:uncharacterized protein J7T55_005402 [Diaporthe amygdali]KAJ0100674.1 hypothetical protein J7T55_005402 [Diaporthe amygdali]
MFGKGQPYPLMRIFRQAVNELLLALTGTLNSSAYSSGVIIKSPGCFSAAQEAFVLNRIGALHDDSTVSTGDLFTKANTRYEIAYDQISKLNTKVSIMKDYLPAVTAISPALRIPQSLTSSLNKILSEMFLIGNRYSLPNVGHNSSSLEDKSGIINYFFLPEGDRLEPANQHEVRLPKTCRLDVRASQRVGTYKIRTALRTQRTHEWDN